MKLIPKSKQAPIPEAPKFTEAELREAGVVEDPTPAAPEPAPVKERREMPRDRHVPDMQRALPQSEDAEKGVLCSVLQSPKAMYEVESTVGESHFYDPARQMIFRALKELHEDNSPIDLVSVTQYLTDKGQLEQVGGAYAVTELSFFVPTAANLSYYLNILCEKHKLRQVILTATEMAALAYESDQSEGVDILDRAEDNIRALRSLGGRNGRLPDLDDMSTLMGENRPPAPPELIKGLLHQGSKIIIGGTSKGRKTFSLMDMAISVATGRPWWEFETKQGKVCYLNFEIQRSFFAKRFEDICRKLAVTPAPGQFMCWTLRGMVEGIEKMSDQLIKSLTQYDFSLIVVDPIYKALGDRDENKAGDVASLCNELERIAVRTGAAIAFGAHYSKGNQAGKESIDRIGGSGVFARDPDTILTMTPHEEEECFTVDATLRNFPPMPPFVVKWEWPLFVRDEMADPANLKKPKNVRSTRESKSGQFAQIYSVQDILDSLKEAKTSRSASELQHLVQADCGMKSSKFWMLWKEAKSSPYVTKQGARFVHLENLQTKE